MISGTGIRPDAGFDLRILDTGTENSRISGQNADPTILILSVIGNLF
jgi:hypothetical protein